MQLCSLDLRSIVRYAIFAKDNPEFEEKLHELLENPDEQAVLSLTATDLDNGETFSLALTRLTLIRSDEHNRWNFSGRTTTNHVASGWFKHGEQTDSIGGINVLIT